LRNKLLGGNTVNSDSSRGGQSKPLFYRELVKKKKQKKEESVAARLKGIAGGSRKGEGYWRRLTVHGPRRHGGRKKKEEDEHHLNI